MLHRPDFGQNGDKPVEQAGVKMRVFHFDHFGDGGKFGDKRECPVYKDRYNSGYHLSFFIGRLFIVRADKIHYWESMLA